MKVAVPVLFALSLCGCTTAKLTDYTVRGLSNSQLCANWGSSSAAQRVSSNGKLIWAEIKARHLFSDAVSEEIYMQRLAIGCQKLQWCAPWGRLPKSIELLRHPEPTSSGSIRPTWAGRWGPVTDMSTPKMA